MLFNGGVLRAGLVRRRILEVLNGWLAIANTYSAELMAHQGFDSVTIDLQHGPVDFGAAVGMLTAISTTPAVPMVRVPHNEPILTLKLLDAGAF